MWYSYALYCLGNYDKFSIGVIASSKTLHLCFSSVDAEAVGFEDQMFTSCFSV